MPADFQHCVDSGGRVRRMSGPSKEHGLKAGEYVNYCYMDGKSYRGDVKMKKMMKKMMGGKKKSGGGRRWKKVGGTLHALE